MIKKIPWNKGIPHSEETKQKIRLKAIGRIVSEETRSKISKTSKGKKHNISIENRKRIGNASRKRLLGIPQTEKHKAAVRLGRLGVTFPEGWKENISKALKGRSAPWATGSNNWNWQGGITGKNHKLRNSTEFMEWRTKIFERDNDTCQMCCNSNLRLQAHHIKKLSTHMDLALVIENGITLCVDCHKRTFRQEQQYEFLCNFILESNNFIEVSD